MISLGHVQLQKAFRQRQVRLFDGQRVCRVSSRTLLQPGQLLFINKPAGLKVQGVKNSLDALMRTGLRLRPTDDPKLVHRLDRNASGVMVVARDADAATWLSAAFKDKSLQGQAGGSSPTPDQQLLAPGLHIRRVYHALLARQLPRRQEGSIRMPLLVAGRKVEALTHYRVMQSSPQGISWVELEPVTGRQHQLRIHCARVLQAPILGDASSLDLGGALPGGRTRALPLFLHARKMLLKKPGEDTMKVVAPLPVYMMDVIHALGWPLPV
ncbi:uncharacterized protein HaLaN_26292 [Haematococcus lacustris]|uniref:Pseudouridine synthase RsuA/RluA-like domain-containing protein n=1 Tax=Haematococcus lacustris TaxID=44745 RepID=A0A6A0A5X9_HAELA|nr:uncharacterized protein HaLaN_26292 [Haematococcus lacustris]